ncbi:MAG: hypothetical protein AAFU79_07240 [Myxococcota bacterium]
MDAALSDEASGNFASARTNLKLALVFAPDRPDILAALKRCSTGHDSVGADGSADNPGKEASHLYDRARKAEQQEDYDAAISLLERAVDLSQQGRFFNHLGVLYGMRKLEYSRALRHLERAVELEPNNPIFRRNLERVQAAAARGDDTRDPRWRRWLRLPRRKG